MTLQTVLLSATYLAQADELKSNGYQVLKGKKPKEFKELMSGTDINDGTKTTALGLFSFRAVLNIGMLLTERGSARLLRSRLLDNVLDVMAKVDPIVKTEFARV